MDHPARMGAIKVQHSGERLRGPLYLAETEVAQRLHQMAMNTVASLEIVVEDEKVGQGDGEVVDLHGRVDLLRSVGD